MAYWVEKKYDTYDISLKISYSTSVRVVAKSYEDAIAFLIKEFDDDADETHFDFTKEEPDSVYAIDDFENEQIRIY